MKRSEVVYVNMAAATILPITGERSDDYDRHRGLQDQQLSVYVFQSIELGRDGGSELWKGVQCDFDS